MKFSALIAVIATSTILAGCVAQPARTQQPVPATKLEPHDFKPIKFEHDPKIPESLNFSRQLDIPVFQCNLEAATGGTAVRYGNRQMIAEYSDSLVECIKYSKSQGDEAVARLKAAKVPAKQAELSKDLYAKWSAYLMTMSPYRTPDRRANAEYQAAKQALATEVKFAD